MHYKMILNTNDTPKRNQSLPHSTNTTEESEYVWQIHTPPKSLSKQYAKYQMVLYLIPLLLASYYWLLISLHLYRNNLGRWILLSFTMIYKTELFTISNWLGNNSQSKWNYIAPAHCINFNPINQLSWRNQDSIHHFKLIGDQITIQLKLQEWLQQTPRLHPKYKCYKIDKHVHDATIFHP